VGLGHGIAADMRGSGTLAAVLGGPQMKTWRKGQSGGAQTTASGGGKLRATDGCSSPSRRWAGEDGHNILGGYFFGVVDEIMDFCKGVVASLAA
jgi:hypothetical protein